MLNLLLSNPLSGRSKRIEKRIVYLIGYYFSSAKFAGNFRWGW